MIGGLEGRDKRVLEEDSPQRQRPHFVNTKEDTYKKYLGRGRAQTYDVFTSTQTPGPVIDVLIDLAMSLLTIIETYRDMLFKNVLFYVLHVEILKKND